MHFEATIDFAKHKDTNDILASFRDRFYFPQINGKDSIYFCGNSLGLQAKSVQPAIQQELDD